MGLHYDSEGLVIFLRKLFMMRIYRCCRDEYITRQKFMLFMMRIYRCCRDGYNIRTIIHIEVFL